MTGLYVAMQCVSRGRLIHSLDQSLKANLYSAIKSRVNRRRYSLILLLFSTGKHVTAAAAVQEWQSNAKLLRIIEVLLNV